nr:hypothetical protein [Morbakka sp. MKL-2023]
MSALISALVLFRLDSQLNEEILGLFLRKFLSDLNNQRYRCIVSIEDGDGRFFSLGPSFFVSPKSVECGYLISSIFSFYERLLSNYSFNPVLRQITIKYEIIN